MLYPFSTVVNVYPEGANEIEMLGRERERWLALQIAEEAAENSNRKAGKKSAFQALLTIFLAIW
jgi:hypothetical protein